MKIRLTTIYVDDLDKALAFYTGVLGLTKKADFKNGGYRWLTVAPADDPNGVELHLELNANPAAAAYQKAMFAANQPAVMFMSDDLEGEARGITARGGTFTMPPTDVTASMIAQIPDGAGNLVQLTQLKWGG